jgi:phage shock protein A
MSLWSRFVRVFSGKANAALDRIEDPRETLELAYQKQLAALQDARRGVADVLTSEKRLELEADSLRNNAERYSKSAAEAARAGNDAAARSALEREAFVNAQRDRLLSEVAGVRAQRQGLEDLAERISRRVESFRTEKIALGARYAAAKATSRAGATVTGISSDMEDVVRMVEQARDKSAEAQARAAALVQLAGTGVDSAAAADVDAATIDARLAALKSAAPPSLTE